MDVSDSTFLVTGGGSGLGGACVRMLLDAGANVVLVDLAGDREGNADERPDRVAVVRADVADDEQVAAAVATARERFGALHGVVNCAGIGRPGRLLGRDGMLPFDALADVIAVNLLGTLNVIRHALPEIVRAPAPEDGGERGAIVNTASAAAFDGQAGQVAYAAAKGGVAAMTLPLARELARERVRVNAIAPGVFDTPILGTLGEAARTAIADAVPFPRRLGRPAEFAALVRHLLVNEMVNGEVVRLDGALRLGPP